MISETRVSVSRKLGKFMREMISMNDLNIFLAQREDSYN